MVMKAVDPKLVSNYEIRTLKILKMDQFEDIVEEKVTN